MFHHPLVPIVLNSNDTNFFYQFPRKDQSTRNHSNKPSFDKLETIEFDKTIRKRFSNFPTKQTGGKTEKLGRIAFVLIFVSMKEPRAYNFDRRSRLWNLRKREDVPYGRRNSAHVTIRRDFLWYRIVLYSRSSPSRILFWLQRRKYNMRGGKR